MTNKKTTISVLGSGTWGTALACLLCDNGHAVTLYTPFDAEALELKTARVHKNLPGLVIPAENNC